MPAYSHSRLSTYQSCPRKFWFQYIEKPELDGEGEGIEAFLGKRVHEALEKLYKDLVLAKNNTLEELLSFYQREWEKNWHPDVFISRKEYSRQHYFDTGRIAIGKYFERYKPFDNTQTLGTEQLISFKLGGYTIRGYIDRIARAGNGEYEIHDYKTSAKLPNQSILDEDRQLALYQIALGEMFSDVKRVKLVWHYVVFDQEMVSYRSPAQIDDLKNETIELIKTIERDKIFECRPGGLCGWCDYEDLCPARKHSVKISSLPPNKYLKDSGVKLVSNYAGIKSEIAELNREIAKKQEELEKIKEAAIAYSKKNDETSIFGKGFCLTVKEQKILEFPGSNEDGREELENLIHKLKLWDEVSYLQTKTLAKLVMSGDLDAETRKKIMKYGNETKEFKVGFKKSEEEE